MPENFPKLIDALTKLIEVATTAIEAVMAECKKDQ